MLLTIAYYYRKPGLDAAQHGQICELLSRLQSAGLIAAFTVEDADAAFPTNETQQPLFGRLKEFAMRHHVGLARVFGSQRHGFCYLPQQFLHVSESDDLREVFPCRVGDSQIEPLEFLESIESGEPWTVRSGAGMVGKKHAVLVAQILSQPDTLEPGLTLRGKDVQVSLDFGEMGFIDLMFEDHEAKTLLIEVKVKADELDKAFGQILRHRHFFAQQNHMEEASIRAGIACPCMPPFRRKLCEQYGISCFEIPQAVTAKL